LIGFATLIFGASSVATELKYDLNAIWDQPPDADESIGDTIKHRSYALAIVLGCGFLLVVSLAVSSVVSAAGSFLMSMLPMSEVLLQLLNMLVSVVVITGVFAVLFKYLPDVTIEWRDVLLGAAFTSVLFSIGKFLIGLYLGKASFGSTYGAAGSLVILLVWVYYSSQIFFFGAEFTQVYAAEHGSNPRRRRGWRRRPDQVGGAGGDTLPASTGQAAAGMAHDGKRPIGVFGTLVGSALAFKKAVRGIKR
jgi:membrane protein